MSILVLAFVLLARHVAGQVGDLSARSTRFAFWIFRRGRLHRCLGYLGTQPPEGWLGSFSRVFTFLYFVVLPDRRRACSAWDRGAAAAAELDRRRGAEKKKARPLDHDRPASSCPAVWRCRLVRLDHPGASAQAAEAPGSAGAQVARSSWPFVVYDTAQPQRGFKALSRRLPEPSAVTAFAVVPVTQLSRRPRALSEAQVEVIGSRLQGQGHYPTRAS